MRIQRIVTGRVLLVGDTLIIRFRTMKQVASITTIDQKTSSEPQTEEKILSLWQSDWMHLDAMEKLAFFLRSLFRSTCTSSTFADSTDSDPNFR